MLLCLQVLLVVVMVVMVLMVAVLLHKWITTVVVCSIIYVIIIQIVLLIIMLLVVIWRSLQTRLSHSFGRRLSEDFYVDIVDRIINVEVVILEFSILEFGHQTV